MNFYLSVLPLMLSLVVEYKYDISVYDEIMDLFDALPLAAIMNKQVYLSSTLHYILPHYPLLLFFLFSSLLICLVL